MSKELIEISFDLIAMSNSALPVSDGDVEAWIPKSLIEYNEEPSRGDSIDIKLPEWLAIEKGFI
jgi:hypothetical protein